MGTRPNHRNHPSTAYTVRDSRAATARVAFLARVSTDDQQDPVGAIGTALGFSQTR